MHFLRLLRRGDFAGPDGPDGLVGDDDVGPAGFADHFVDGFELGGDDGDGGVGFALFKRLAAAEAVGGEAR